MTNAFFAKPDELNQSDYVIATYWFETEIDPEEAATALCQEQSTAQWKRVGIDEDFRPRHGAKIIDLQVLSESDRPTSPTPFAKGPVFKQCRVKIAEPHINFGPKIANLLTVVAGEGAYYSPGIHLIKLEDLDFPEEYLSHFEGPQFGVAGLRDWLEIYDRPFFFGVVKPNIGLKPEAFCRVGLSKLARWLRCPEG